MKVSIGMKIPEFSLQNQSGDWVHSSSFYGKKIVLFFYPKDDTYLCTKEACSFRDHYQEFIKHNIHVIGISSDSILSHQSFVQKYSLPFPLLSDETNEVRDIMGVPKGLFGLLPGRVTFCIDEQGIILYIFNSSFSADNHINEALRIFDFT
jgi:thioredoxin-dependent peroxiredoxin